MQKWKNWLVKTCKRPQQDASLNTCKAAIVRRKTATKAQRDAKWLKIDAKNTRMIHKMTK